MLFLALMVMRSFVGFLSVLLLSSCHEGPVVRFVAMKDFVLVDTGCAPNRLLDSADGDFPIYYIGHLRDSIHIGRRYWREWTPVEVWPKYFWCSRRFSGNALHIEVDTAHVVDAPVMYLKKNGDPDPDATPHFRSHVFTIQNISDSIHYMGRTFSVFYVHREYRDRRGNWVPGNQSLADLPLCLTGQPSIYLRPGEMILSKVRLCKGDFATECRLAFGRDGEYIYSNVFRDSIDERRL